MSAIASQINGNSAVCLTACSDQQQENTKSPPMLVICEGNPPMTDGFPSQRDSNAEIVSISWRHHEEILTERFPRDNHDDIHQHIVAQVSWEHGSHYSTVNFNRILHTARGLQMYHRSHLELKKIHLLTMGYLRLVQLGAVITRSNIAWYNIQHCNDSSRK